jgi:capsular polysaccharide biosynthesis protein
LFILFGSDTNGNILNDTLVLDVRNLDTLSFLTEASNNNNTKLYPGVIAGIVIGIVVGVVVR